MRRIELDPSRQEVLKYAAVASMAIGHLGMALFPGNDITFALSRPAFLLFAFLMTYNFLYRTRSKQKYLGRLLLLAFISILPARLLFGMGSDLNIMFTLAAGMGSIWALELLVAVRGNTWKVMLIVYFLMGFILASGLIVDYHFLGVLMPLLFWAALKYPSRGTYAALLVASFALNAVYGSLLMGFFGLGAMALFWWTGRFSGRPIVRIKGKYFYAFYPVHLLIAYGLQQFFGTV